MSRRPWSSARCESSFMLGLSGSALVEAGAVAGQRKDPRRLCLHCCPLVNDRAVGSWSFVYAVIKHSKPPGWQQAHFLAPGHSMENKTCLMLCFPAPWDLTAEESQSRVATVFSFCKKKKVYHCLCIQLGQETSPPPSLFMQFLVCEIISQKANFPRNVENVKT